MKKNFYSSISLVTSCRLWWVRVFPWMESFCRLWILRDKSFYLLVTFHDSVVLLMSSFQTRIWAAVVRLNPRFVLWKQLFYFLVLLWLQTVFLWSICSFSFIDIHGWKKNEEIEFQYSPSSQPVDRSVSLRFQLFHIFSPVIFPFLGFIFSLITSSVIREVNFSQSVSLVIRRLLLAGVCFIYLFLFSSSWSLDTCVCTWNRKVSVPSFELWLFFHLLVCVWFFLVVVFLILAFYLSTSRKENRSLKLFRIDSNFRDESESWNLRFVQSLDLSEEDVKVSSMTNQIASVPGTDLLFLYNLLSKKMHILHLSDHAGFDAIFPFQIDSLLVAVKVMIENRDDE